MSSIASEAHAGTKDKFKMEFLDIDNKALKIPTMRDEIEEADGLYIIEAEEVRSKDGKKVTTTLEDVMDLAASRNLHLFQPKTKDKNGDFAPEDIAWRIRKDELTVTKIIKKHLSRESMLEVTVSLPQQMQNGQALSAKQLWYYCLTLGDERADDRGRDLHDRLKECQLANFASASDYLNAFRDISINLRSVAPNRMDQRQLNDLCMDNIAAEHRQTGGKYREMSKEVQKANKGDLPWEELVAIFLEAERSENKLERDGGGKRKTTDTSLATRGGGGPGNKRRKTTGGERSDAPHGDAPQSDKFHKGITCYNCQREGHYAANCKSKKRPRGRKPDTTQSRKDSKADAKTDQTEVKTDPTDDETESLFLTSAHAEVNNAFSCYSVVESLVLMWFSLLAASQALIGFNPFTSPPAPIEHAFIGVDEATCNRTILEGCDDKVMVMDPGSTIMLVHTKEEANRMFNVTTKNCGYVMMNSHREPIVKRGDLQVSIEDDRTGQIVPMTLRDVCYVPSSKYSLFSATSYLDHHFKRHGKTGAKVEQTIDGTCIRVGENQLWGPRIGKLYYLRIANNAAEQALIVPEPTPPKTTWLNYLNPFKQSE